MILFHRRRSQSSWSGFGRTTFNKGKIKFHFCKKQVMNRNASVIFRFVRLIILLYNRQKRYRTRTKFGGKNFRALAGSEFRGSIFSCGVIFVVTRCSRSEINFQLRSYTRNVKFIRISTKIGLLLLPLGYHVSWTYVEGHREPSSVANCWTVQGSLLYA